MPGYAGEPGEKVTEKNPSVLHLTEINKMDLIIYSAFRPILLNLFWEGSHLHVHAFTSCSFVVFHLNNLVHM